MSSPRSEAARTLGRRVVAARELIGLTQREVADRSDLNETNYAKIERGLGNPTFSTLVRVAGTLGVDASSLVEAITVDDLEPSAPPRPGTRRSRRTSA